VFSLSAVPVRMVALLVAGFLMNVFVGAETVLRCDSHGPRKVCPADTRGGVSLRYQYSSEGCWQRHMGIRCQRHLGREWLPGRFYGGRSSSPQTPES
jgi:hypothetical protein